MTNVACCPRWSGGVMSTSSAFRLPLPTGVSSPDFSDTERSPGSLAVRGVRGTRWGGDGAKLSNTGKTAKDGPEPPFCFDDEDEDEEDAPGGEEWLDPLPVDWEMRLLRVREGVP